MKTVLKFYMSWDWNDISSCSITSLIIFVFLGVFFIILGHSFSKMDPEKDEIPTKGIKFLAVILVDSINKFVKTNLGDRGRNFYAPYLLGVSCFIGLANIASVFGLTPPFSNVGLALTLSLLAFLVFQVTGLKFQGLKNRINGFLGPVKGISFLVFPISLIGEVTTPFAMGLRMFGNIFSGVLIAGVVIGATEALGALVGSIASTVVIAGILHPVFDIFFGLLQMYVYLMLTTMFVKQNME